MTLGAAVVGESSVPTPQARRSPVERRSSAKRSTGRVDRRSPDQDGVAEADHDRKLRDRKDRRARGAPARRRRRDRRSAVLAAPAACRVHRRSGPMKPASILVICLGRRQPARRLPGRASRRGASAPTRSLRRCRPADRAGPWASPAPSSPGTSPTSAFGCLAASSAVTSTLATSSGRGSGWPRSTLLPSSLRCGRRRPILRAPPPISRMPPRPRSASARCSSRTLPPRPSSTLRGRPARPRRPASHSAKANLDKAEEQLGYTELRADVRRRGHRRQGGTRAGGPARADRPHGGSPGHPRGGGRLAREHRAGAQAGSPLRRSPCNSILGTRYRARCGRSLRRRILPPARGG